MVAESKVDLATLVVIAARSVVEDVVAALEERRVHGLRPTHGFVFAALRSDDLTVGELAERLEVSHQAAGKLIAEMEARGLVRRVADRRDARRRRVVLTAAARRAMREGTRARGEIEARLVAACGAEDVAAAHRVLAQVVGWHGGSIDALARRARPVG